MGTYDPPPNDGDGASNGQFWGTWIRGAVSGLDTRVINLEHSTLNTQTGTSYTLVLTDETKTVERTNASANTVTVPPNSSVAFPVGAVVYLRQGGTGSTTVVAGAGVTIRSRGAALALGGQYAGAVLTKRATDEWWLDGDIT